MNYPEKVPEGWNPEVFARLRAESDAEQAARSPEERERLAKFRWDYLDSLDDSDNYALDSLRDKMRDVPGFGSNLNPFPLSRRPGENPEPEYPMPREAPPPSDESFGSDRIGTRTTYDAWTRQPVFYYPVTLRGALLGYLYASVTHNSASFLRNLPSQVPYDPFSDPSLDAGSVWYNRLKAAYAQGLSAQDAVRSWVGVPEDPEGGGIAAGAAEGRAETLESLNQSLNPGGPPMQNPLIQDGTYPDGTPVDRSQGWGPLISSPLRRYPVETAGSVRFYTVTKEGGALGFVWATLAGDGADYLPYGPAGRHGEIAAGLWQLWLSRAFEAGYTPMEALEYCRTRPEDWMSGVIGPDAQAGEFPTLAELKDWAR